jgi:diguanylate cyclase (GGDEF)-like protein/PAS domain S-box-containing protein
MENLERYRQVFEASTVNLMIADANYIIRAINPSLMKTFRAKKNLIQEILPDFDPEKCLGQSMDIFHRKPAHQRAVLSSLRGQWSGIIPFNELNFKVNLMPLDTQTPPGGYLIEWADLEKEQANELARRLRYVMQATQAGIWDWDLKTGEIFHNPFWYETLGLRDTVAANSLENTIACVYPDDRERVRRQLEACREGECEQFILEYRMCHRNGHLIWVRDSGKVIERDVDGQPIRVGGSYVDITHVKEHEKELEYFAHHDVLTGLANRRLLNERIEQAIEATNRTGRGFSLVLVDLDEFKPINDQMGHHVGDEVLVQIAERLKLCLVGFETAARIGGDEFVLVLLDSAELPDVEARMQAIQDVLSQPMNLLTGIQLSLRASMGWTRYEAQQHCDVEHLMLQADKAMYVAKKHLDVHKNFHRFRLEDDPQLKSEQARIKRLEQAYVDKEFVLFYQPKINIKTGEWFSSEALIRWIEPTMGMISPADFIGDIENSWLNQPVGYWVVEQACQQLALWRKTGGPKRVSVNANQSLLMDSRFLERLELMIDQYLDGQGQGLTLEILESVNMAEWRPLLHVVEEAKRLGVSFAMDDFGTGYSSLLQLRRIPVDIIKIDLSFVLHMFDSPEDMAIVEMIIELGDKFKRLVIAEGVESPTHAKALAKMGCFIMQGYSVAKPMPVEALEAWHQAWQADGYWKNL